MPLSPGSSRETVSENISELHKGPKHAETEKEHGKGTADAQSVAIALKEAGLSKNAKQQSTVDEIDREACRMPQL